MKITSFNPEIFTKNAEAIVDLFEGWGFDVRHDQAGIGELNVEGIRMKNPDGFYLDISCPDAELPHDMVGIRMNVDDFESAYQLLLKNGFRNVYVDATVDAATSRSAVLISPSGFAINLIQHKK